MNLFSPKWWIGSIVTAFMTMFFIYLTKNIAAKANIPFVSKVTEEAYK
ncbi:Uncharacterised protein [Streptococcus pneumoniae]|nr:MULTISPECIES: hypothetical protein [Bacilli]CKE76080.1 Uncharacterised protein [Streptococcus pneumoniae]CKE78661.1 Uncharacterised protein [Streptococcus pneumoniae]CKE88247.1 Uncharacterised protein [Streptococcus pneumoniae]CKF08193.1 Uncharacterised protein [Streptococcus pneumoniae]CKF17126.1 Uncharacterised protein [Streptococcus pneumoniae]